MKKLFYFILLVFLSSPFSLKSQEVIEIPPLFEYPVAPEDIASLTERCDYLVKNFWNAFDFKRKDPVDQYALNEAFKVYSSTMPYATRKEVDLSVDKLIEKISGNPILLLQFCKAADVNLYGPNADFWSDDIYIKFLEAVIKNKKVPQSRKTKYEAQLKTLQGSLVGSNAPSFDFTDVNGNKKTYFSMTTPTLLFFGNPDDTDWRLARLRMDSNFNLEDALSKGKINILYIVPFKSENWKANVSNYNKYWTIGNNDEISTIYDIRLDPAIYLIGSDGKILNKNLSVEQAVGAVLQLVN